MVAGFITQRPSRRPFLGWIQFGTRYAQIPLSKSSARKLNIADPPIITVTGKAFFG
jgi:hypothetical protein